MPSHNNPLLSRVGIGLIVAALFFGTAILGGWWWSSLVFCSILLSNRELRKLLMVQGIRPSRTLVYSTAVCMVIFTTLDKPHFLYPILTLTLMASFFLLLLRSPRATIGDIGGTLLSVVYVVFLPIHYILLRQLNRLPGAPHWAQPGLHYLMFILMVICISDIAAYYGGLRFGRTLLYPTISPKKTREGALFGLAAGVGMGALDSLFWPEIPMGHAMVLSVILVIVGQLGDLTESMMKRDVGMKDSGELLASHGGLLDRVDSYIFSGTVCYYYFYWIVLRQGLAPEVLQMIRHLYAHFVR